MRASIATPVWASWCAGLLLSCALAAGAIASEEPAGLKSSSEQSATLQWQPYSDELFPPLPGARKPVVITFGATWCAPCKELEERTFNAPEVLKAAEGFLLLYVDMTAEDSYIRSIRQRFRVSGAPTTIFFGANLAELSRRIGFVPPEEFARSLRETADPPSS